MCFFLKNVCRRLAKGVVSTQPLSTRGGTQMANFVNEDGLYDVILDSSRVVDATANKKFRWLILVKNSEVFFDKYFYLAKKTVTLHYNSTQDYIGFCSEA